MPWNFLPTYENLTIQLIALYALAGFFGALVRVSWLDKPLRGLYRDDSGGLRMGFFAEIIVAIAVAIVVDGHPIRAGVAAVFAPWILNAVKDIITNTVPQVVETWLKSKVINNNKEQ